ncbi:uncharacterized protein EI90DRAFT_3120369 [Cantharellus anzutake]|uniref:uncharacterized protein n=1 Tax=Cantharellus anzutake TaxID=1750568 RepID=UPI001903B1D9|nr:uncharacterized protein EI90DRAFT_3120369 [Cantharellus anzutake]KAF8335340.1 hypothetical protein EI90DRAFT_3120369 [Cantharellus anzutake]
MDDTTIISPWHAVRPKAETAFKRYLHLLAVRNDWNTDEVRALENSGVSDGFLESFWHAQRTNWRSPIRGETLEDAVPADVLEAEVKRVARQSIYQHVEKINRLLKDTAPAMNVLDFFGVPSLSVIDYRKEVLSVQVLASQSIKGRPEWDEFKQEILQKLEPCHPNASCTANPFVDSHSEAKIESPPGSQTHLSTSVAAWQLVIDQPQVGPRIIASSTSQCPGIVKAPLATEFQVPRLPATNGGIVQLPHIAPSSESASASGRRTKGGNSVKLSPRAGKLAMSAGSWTSVHCSTQADNETMTLEQLCQELADTSLTSLGAPVFVNKPSGRPTVSSTDSISQVALYPSSSGQLAGSYSRHRTDGPPSVVASSSTSSDLSMLLQSISDKSSTQFSEADINAISALCLNEKIAVEDLAQVLRSHFSISKAFVRCLIQMCEAWLENRD